MIAPRRPLVMGIVNVTPDSFSDGGRSLELEAAVAHARRLIAEGADLLDIGGESTRPGAEPVGEAEEIARVVPVIAALSAAGAPPISIDTMKPAVARAAFAAGATIWNDITALGSPDSLAAAADLGGEVVLMHMQGRPRTMQADPRYDDVVAEVRGFLAARAEAAVAAGVDPAKIWLDPGIGFGKTAAHNLALIAGLDQIVGLGFRVLLGASRKGFIRRIDPAAKTADDRLGGSLAIAMAGARAGVAAVRVHDVRETVQALAVSAAIISSPAGGGGPRSGGGGAKPGADSEDPRRIYPRPSAPAAYPLHRRADSAPVPLPLRGRIGRVLIIAGSDSGGGAGVQADIKTVTVLGGYAASAITAVTVQNTLGVEAVHPIPPAIIAAQIRAVLSDIGADAIKTGMLGGADAALAVAEALADYPDIPLVVDPVMIAKGGARLMSEAAMTPLRRLMARASLVTPNAPEAAALTGLAVGTTDGLRATGHALLTSGVSAVLMKGGHVPGESVIDILMTSDGETVLEGPRIDTRHTHGTGCTLASACAAGLAQGMGLEAAVARAWAYTAEAIARAPGFGAGHGPLDHAWPVRD